MADDPNFDDDSTGQMAELLSGARQTVIRAPDRFIASCNSWDNFWEQTKQLPSKANKAQYLSDRLNFIC